VSRLGLRHRAPLAAEGHLPHFDAATGWLNSPPLSVDELRGRVVLVDFWTYTCIHWLRTLAYVRAWAEKYQNRGLVVLGVHTPEFPFERDVDNVRRAAENLNVRYPIALDSDYEIWRAFGNRYWPAVYLADANGRMRHHQFGEGGYDECERGIQQLLREAGAEAPAWSENTMRGVAAFRPGPAQARPVRSSPEAAPKQVEPGPGASHPRDKRPPRNRPQCLHQVPLPLPPCRPSA
jgi:thiol-disulfide isomerase/thioredoxin